MNDSLRVQARVKVMLFRTKDFVVIKAIVRTNQSNVTHVQLERCVLSTYTDINLALPETKGGIRKVICL